MSTQESDPSVAMNPPEIMCFSSSSFDTPVVHPDLPSIAISLPFKDLPYHVSQSEIDATGRPPTARLPTPEPRTDIHEFVGHTLEDLIRHCAALRGDEQEGGVVVDLNGAVIDSTDEHKTQGPLFIALPADPAIPSPTHSSLDSPTSLCLSYCPTTEVSASLAATPSDKPTSFFSTPSADLSNFPPFRTCSPFHTSFNGGTSTPNSFRTRYTPTGSSGSTRAVSICGSSCATPPAHLSSVTAAHVVLMSQISDADVQSPISRSGSTSFIRNCSPLDPSRSFLMSNSLNDSFPLTRRTLSTRDFAPSPRTNTIRPAPIVSSHSDKPSHPDSVHGVSSDHELLARMGELSLKDLFCADLPNGSSPFNKSLSEGRNTRVDALPPSTSNAEELKVVTPSSAMSSAAPVLRTLLSRSMDSVDRLNASQPEDSRRPSPLSTELKLQRRSIENLRRKPSLQFPLSPSLPDINSDSIDGNRVSSPRIPSAFPKNGLDSPLVYASPYKTIAEANLWDADKSADSPDPIASGIRVAEEHELEFDPLTITLRGTGVTLRNGKLRLPDNMMLQLVGDGFHLENLDITGTGRIPAATGHKWEGPTSFPLVNVLGGSATFTNVSISGNEVGHGLSISDSATVELQSCRFEHNDLVGLYITGRSTSVSASDCTCSNNALDGVAVSNGANASFIGGCYTDNGMQGIDVSREGGSVTLERCRIERNHEHGAAVCGSASLTVTECDVIENRCAGVSVSDRESHLVVTSSRLHRNKAAGCDVGDSAECTMTKCEMIGNEWGVGAGGKGSRLTLSWCNISLSKSVHIKIDTAAIVRMVGGMCKKSGGKGVTVSHPGSILMATGASFVENDVSGVAVNKMGCVKLTECHITGNQISGLHVSDPDSYVQLDRCVLSNNVTIGMFANKASRSLLSNCHLDSNGSTGCEARDRLTRIRLNSCTLNSNKRVGLYSHSAASVVLSKCDVMGSGVKALLVGGRKTVDIGGGVVEYDVRTTLNSGVMLRHSGRALLVTEFTPLEASRAILKRLESVGDVKGVI